jgi:glycosyltransferase involved in cell wall biosynthesis
VQCNKKEIGLIGSIRSLCLTFLRRWLASRANVNVGVSPHVARRAALPRTKTIWNGVETNIKPLSDEELSGSWQFICFGYLGRLVTEKGLPVLLQASRCLVSEGFQFRLRIVGDGPERSNLEKLAQDYGLADHIEFVGPVVASAIEQTLRGVSVIVMPSVWEDVAPLVAMEQMMEGRLLIASDIGGLGLIVDGNGLKFPAGDAKALASCMRQVLVDPSSAMALAKRGRERATQIFTRDRMVEEHARLYFQLICN